MKLVLFFTGGLSLADWDEKGMFEREVALYQRLASLGVETTFITYGGSSDLNYADRIPGIEIRCNDRGLPQFLYKLLIPWLHKNSLEEADIIKTNQMLGADIAMRSARKFNKPLITRGGYILSDAQTMKFGEDSKKTRDALAMQDKVFKASSRIVITTEAMRDTIVSRAPSLATRTIVTPNYVDTDAFTPGSAECADPLRICYVGRLNQRQKNIRALIGALRGLKVKLDVVGDGGLYDALEQEADQRIEQRMHRRVPNDCLPDILRQSSIFVLPSFWEGHPKVMIEAMACGMAIVASDVPGIGNILQDGKTGLLCGTDADSVRAAITKLLNDTDLRNTLGENARRFAVEHYSLSTIVKKEHELYRTIVEGSDEQQ